MLRVRGRMETIELPWNFAEPDVTVAALRARFGSVSALALSIGLGFLEVARPELPPMPVADARRMLMRDADRYFPLERSAAIALGRQQSLAFAMDGEQLQRWVRAFETWAPVRSIVAAPNAIAAALARRDAGVHELAVDAAHDERGFVRVQNGAVLEARRVPVALETGARNATGALSDGALNNGALGVPAQFSSALSALESEHDEVDAMLADATLDREMRNFRRQRRLWSYAMLTVSVVALVAALDASRSRTLRATRAAADSLSLLAAPGLAARARLATNEQEISELRVRASLQNDALGVLAQLSATLPTDAFVQRIEWDGTEWRMEGSANQAASIVPRLDTVRTFTNVRVMNASTRFRDGNRTRESFSIAFRTRQGANANR